MSPRHGSNDRRPPVFATRLRAAAAHVCGVARPVAAMVMVAVWLTGCTSVSRSTVDTMRLYWHGTPKLSPTAEQVDAKPYFQLHVTSKNGDAILILGNIVGTKEYWYGPSGTALVLQHGRVVQTIGLASNLDDSRVDGASDPFAHGLQSLGSTGSYERIDDWSPGYRYGIPVHADLTSAGNVTIDILGTTHDVLLVTEHVSSKAAGYRAANRYWVDPRDGFVWKSEQEVLPGLTMTLTELRPYRGDRP